MKCQRLFFGGENIVSLSSAELAQRVVKVKHINKLVTAKVLVPLTLL